MPKDALFGGTRRARISSQCLKRAVRQDFIRKSDGNFFQPDELALRTKRLYKAIADRLADVRKEEEAEVLAKAEIAMSYVKLKAGEGGKTQYLLYLGQNEIAAIAQAIHQHWDKIVPAVDDPKDKGKAKGKKAAASEAPKEVREKIDSIFNGPKAVDLRSSVHCSPICPRRTKTLLVRWPTPFQPMPWRASSTTTRPWTI